jgi:hypothetical protein
MVYKQVGCFPPAVATIAASATINYYGTINDSASIVIVIVVVVVVVVGGGGGGGDAVPMQV